MISGALLFLASWAYLFWSVPILDSSGGDGGDAAQAASTDVAQGLNTSGDAAPVASSPYVNRRSQLRCGNCGSSVDNKNAKVRHQPRRYGDNLGHAGVSFVISFYVWPRSLFDSREPFSCSLPPANPLLTTCTSSRAFLSFARFVVRTRRTSSPTTTSLVYGRGSRRAESNCRK